MSKHSQTRFVTVNCKFQKSKVDFEENKLEMQNKEQRLAYAFRGAAAELQWNFRRLYLIRHS